VASKVLTPFQDQVLLLLFEQGLGGRGYFFTGGSALAEFYLQHRQSDDLDLFTRSDRNLKADFDDLAAILVSEGLEIVEQNAGEQFVRFFLHNPEPGERDLKVELARDAKARMAPSVVVGKIIVDSFEDISVNKVCAILQREPPERKDFVNFTLSSGNPVVRWIT
jgi:predicted nucleotidyltransferase component of viral defense system